MGGGETAEELPEGAVVAEDEVLAAVGNVAGDDVEGAAGEGEVEGVEEGTGGGGGGGDDEAEGTKIDVHNGAMALGEGGEGGVGEAAEEGERAEDRPPTGAWGKWEVRCGVEAPAEK